MTINVENYKSFPADEAAGARRLHEVTQLQRVQPDIICVQEGREDEDDHLGHLCDAFGYAKLQSSAWGRLPLDPSSLISNQIFVRRDCPWEVIDRGAEIISSKLLLTHQQFKGRPFHLPVRTVVWVRVKPKARSSDEGPAVAVLNTHISGGRYEDQCFLQRLAEERRRQPERVMALFQREAGDRDVGIIVGDFNASRADVTDGPMQRYFRAAIARSPSVRADAARQGLSEAAVEARFAEYMTAPFGVFAESGWTFAYNEETVGPTSVYGHLVDHMAVSSCQRARTRHAERLLTCKGTEGPAIGVPISDHNAVKCTFDLQSLLAEPAWHSGGPLPERGALELIDLWAQRRGRRRAGGEVPRVPSTGAPEQRRVLLRQAEGHASVRILAEPHPGAAVAGEVSSGELALAVDERGDFLHVRWRGLEGWVGRKNASMPEEGGERAGDLLAGAGPEYQVVVRQAEGHATVRALAEPRPGAEFIGEIPSGELAVCTDLKGDFSRVRWNQLDGWVGVKNTKAAPVVANMGSQSGTVDADKGYRVMVRQAEGHPSVRVMVEPHPNAAVVGEIPTGDMATVKEHRAEFVRVGWQHLDGWIGLKNVAVASVRSDPGGGTGVPSSG